MMDFSKVMKAICASAIVMVAGATPSRAVNYLPYDWVPAPRGASILIAAVAAVTLTAPGHTGKKYVITGSEALSYRQATDILGEAIGRPLRFVDEPVDEARARLTRAGQPAWLVDSLLAIATYQRAGGPTETITSVVADLTGKPPRTFASFARDNAAAFLPPR
jgi:uncharacterized protein YbjT (DUF2867 family)